MVKLDTRIKRNDKWLTSDMDGETVMMNIENGNYYAMSTVGTSIWDKIENFTPVNELCDHLQQEYQVEPHECEADTLKFLNELEKEGIIIVD